MAEKNIDEIMAEVNRLAANTVDESRSGALDLIKQQPLEVRKKILADPKYKKLLAIIGAKMRMGPADVESYLGIAPKSDESLLTSKPKPELSVADRMYSKGITF
jgi:hypothetical protein